MANTAMETCIFYGADTMSDIEILSLMLNRPAKAADLLAGTNLAELMMMPINQLMGMGMTKPEACRIACLMEIYRRSQRRTGPVRVTSPRAAAAYLMPKAEGMTEEVFGVLALNAKAEIVGERIVGKGIATGVLVTPREVLRLALQMGATSIIVWHNHPSGDPTPSAEDRVLTNRMRAACDTMAVALSDHIIVGRASWHSFRAADGWDRL